MSAPASVSSSSNTRSSTPVEPAQRIVLKDNTESVSHLPSDEEDIPTPRSSVLSHMTSRKDGGPGRRETLRKAIAQRKYRRWSMDPNSAPESESEVDDEPPDPNAAGVVVSRDTDEEQEIGSPVGADRRVNTIGSEASSARPGQQGDGPASDGRARTVRKARRTEKEIAEIDVLYENQRGMFACGIPLFSYKSLLNFDPAPWQNVHFHDSAVSIFNAQLPDPSWVWDWKSWYVDMTNDVDEEGWSYSFSFNPAFSWHGNHVWFHSFVRRRRWLRKRIKLPSHSASAAADLGSSSREDSIERAGHGLNGDYFTIHSRQVRRRSAIDGSEWGGGKNEEEEEEGVEEDIADIPTLMKVMKRSRLDREKVEAVEKFVEQGGEEVAYLAEKMPQLMQFMIFQASRRQLLAHLIKTLNQAESEVKEAARSQSPLSSSSQQPLLPEQVGTDGGTEEKNKKAEEQEVMKRKATSLRGAVEAADREVKKLEFWSDVKGVAQEGESVSAEVGEWESEELGLSGPGVKSVNGRDSPAKDDKGKGKEVER